MSNFTFLKSEFPKLFESTSQAESLFHVSPTICMQNVRKVCEYMVREMFNRSGTQIPRDSYGNFLRFNDLLETVEFMELLKNGNLRNKIHKKIRKPGNIASHEITDSEQNKAKDGLETLFEFSKSFYFKFSENDILETTFSIENITKTFYSDAEIRKISDNFTEKIKELNHNQKKEIDEQQNIIFELQERLKQSEKELSDIKNLTINNFSEDSNSLKSNLSKIGIHLEDSAITLLNGKIWGRIYLNFSRFGKRYYAIRYFTKDFTKERGLIEKYVVKQGNYADSDLYNSHPKKYNNLKIEDVLAKRYDNLNLVGDFSKEKYGTPSILLKTLLDKVLNTSLENFNTTIEANNERLSFKKNLEFFDFKGSYYKVNNDLYRNALAIKRKNSTTTKYDALVVMMNPGGSRAINIDSYKSKDSFNKLEFQFVDCIPDDTQGQITELMQLENWNNVIVLNLFDKCELSSSIIVERYRKEATDGNKHLFLESIFVKDRLYELNLIFNNLSAKAPIIIGWGVDPKLKYIKDKIFKNLEDTGRKIIGFKNKDNDYYHPWPRDENSNIRREWVKKVKEQINAI